MNWKTPITLVVLLVVLLGSAYFGWQSVTAAPAKSDTSTTPTTTTHTTCTKQTHLRKGQRVKSSDITVNVFNAGSVTGLAAGTLGSLTAKGFLAGQATDAPARVKANDVVILDPATHSPQVKLVAKQFTGTVVISKGNLSPGIDVVIGDAFQSVNPQAKSFLVVRKTAHTCK